MCRLPAPLPIARPADARSSGMHDRGPAWPIECDLLRSAIMRRRCVVEPVEQPLRRWPSRRGLAWPRRQVRNWLSLAAWACSAILPVGDVDADAGKMRGVPSAARLMLPAPHRRCVGLTRRIDEARRSRMRVLHCLPLDIVGMDASRRNPRSARRPGHRGRRLAADRNARGPPLRSACRSTQFQGRRHGRPTAPSGSRRSRSLSARLGGQTVSVVSITMAITPPGLPLSSITGE